jgi:pSer/pThr/pTyr-binding forkhead associated (FHA) protein
VITCPKCSKENQDHYKFCLGCGAELPRDAAPKPFAPRTPPHGMKAVAAKAVAAAAPPEVAASPFGMPMSAARSSPPAAAADAGAPAAAAALAAAPAPTSAAPAAAAPDATVVCPQCAHVNQSAFKFCASCGFSLGKVAPAAAAPAAAPAAAGSAGPVAPARLTALRADGSEAGTFDVPGGVTVIGRDLGGVFGGDNYLSPRHATLTRRERKLFIKDLGSTNGTYLRLKREAPEPIVDGQMFRIGQEIIRFEMVKQQQPVDGVEIIGSPVAGYVGRIALVIGRDTVGNAFPVPETGVHIGRERGHILFPEDGYVSGLHCSITRQGDTVLITDLGSSNGTFVRVPDEREIHDGDVLLMGQQLFKVAL